MIKKHGLVKDEIINMSLSSMGKKNSESTNHQVNFSQYLTPE